MVDLDSQNSERNYSFQNGEGISKNRKKWSSKLFLDRSVIIEGKRKHKIANYCSRLKSYLQLCYEGPGSIVLLELIEVVVWNYECSFTSTHI